MKVILLLLTLVTMNFAYSDSFFSKIFLNRIPLKAEVRKDIEMFFLDHIKVAKIELSCFQSANNKQQAMVCAKKVDMLNSKRMKISGLNESQLRVNKTNWSSGSKKQLVKEVQLKVKGLHAGRSCVSKSKTVGDLNRCFENSGSKT